MLIGGRRVLFTNGVESEDILVEVRKRKFVKGLSKELVYELKKELGEALREECGDMLEQMFSEDYGYGAWREWLREGFIEIFRRSVPMKLRVELGESVIRDVVSGKVFREAS